MPTLSVHILPSSTKTVTSLHSHVPLCLIKEVLTRTVIQLSTGAQKNKGKSLDAEILFKVSAWEQALLCVTFFSHNFSFETNGAIILIITQVKEVKELFQQSSMS